MNSNWQIYKIGLVNFWYYDEEEFRFEAGRMLLRGANGSGKSVTMQSFIPLLLDGNMRPERLDPFGSRARRMENYLLEDNDGRDERTGYLYMEFKREDADTYLTIGIGMRARRGKGMDTWYFFLKDGRRIGKDFYLYRQEKEKIPLTKQEIKNRIGEGGKVIESQREYMAQVNKLIFGFETEEAYKELIDLLIQLRTPKLSKDFKPSIINDILSSSLMPLSEDDLRPMSEAIENMDGLKAGLDSLKESQAAAKRIGRVYGKYNRLVIFDKARQYRQYSHKKQRESQELGQLEAELHKNRKRLEEETNRCEDLRGEQKIRQDELASYGDSDIVKIKREQEGLEKEQQRTKSELEKKNNIHESKREQRIETENRCRDTRQQVEQLEGEITKRLDDMGDVLTHVSFDDHEFIKTELLADLKRSYSFEACKELLERMRNLIDKGTDQLKEEQVQKQRYDTQLKEVEEQTAQRDSKEREVIQHEDMLRVVKNELLEALSLWDTQADEFQMPGEVLREIMAMVENYDSASHYEAIRAKAMDTYQQCQETLWRERSNIVHEQELKIKEIEAKNAEIELWEKQEDPIPERSDEVIRNRERLIAAGIEYHELYKVIDFPEGLKEEQKNRLEEALAAMGLLDALVVDRKDFADIQKMDTGVCDHYIVTDTGKVKGNLLEVMNIANEDNSILLYQNISRALEAVGYCSREPGHTEIYEDGHYRLGALTGTITGTYQAKYIGVQARQAYREERIAQLLQERTSLLAQKAVIDERIAAVEQRLTRLAEQWKQFPGGEDLQVAIQSLVKAKSQLEWIRSRLSSVQEALNEQMKQLSELRQEIRKICEKIYLPSNLEIFQAAKEEVDEYRTDLFDLEMLHSKYLSAHSTLQVVLEQIDRLDEDIDNTLADIRDLEHAQKRINARMVSIEDQLAMPNTAEIEAKISFVTKRVGEIPSEIEACIAAITTLKGQIAGGEKSQMAHTEALLVLRRQCQILGEGLLQEAALGYYTEQAAELAAGGAELVEKLAEDVFRTEESTLGDVDKSVVTGELQAVYFENRALLTEYNPVLNEIFRAQPEAEAENFQFHRLDLRTRYRGVSVSFQEFLARINHDIDEKMGLLSDKERELFEDILLGVINRKIRVKIAGSEVWVERMNKLMGEMKTSSGLRLSLRWQSKSAEHEGQLDTRQLVALLKKDQKWMKEEESAQLLGHFRSKIEAARKTLEQTQGVKSFHSIVREILDYRQWFEFRLEFEKSGEKKKELTDRAFFTFSGGEKAMAMYVPLFSAVVAKYKAARPDAPRLISLDEAFAGVDSMNINDMFRLMVDLRFSFIINSQILWGDCESVPRLAVYHLLRDDNARFVTVMRYIWNGKVRKLEV